MQSWIHAIGTPLGLAGFAMFLVFSTFGLKAKQNTKKASNGKAVGLFGVAIVGLVGSLYLAHENIASTASQSLSVGDVSQNLGAVDKAVAVRLSPDSLPASTSIASVHQAASSASEAIALDLTGKPPQPASAAH